MGEVAPAPGNPAADQRSLHDELRTRGSVVRHEGGWVVLGHDEVVAAAQDPSTFSSRVTARRAIPNALDGAEHAAYRAVVDRYLTTERVEREEEQCRRHAAALVDGLARGRPVDAVAAFGLPYAVRAQSTWLGWAPDLEQELVAWVADNHAATRSGDRARTAEVAERFDRIIRRLLDERRRTSTRDVTTELMGDQVHGRPLTDEEIVSILRNWTAGDLGSLAASIGVVAHQLATTPAIQDDVRSHVQADDRDAVTAAVLEMLRIDDPFVANRRRTTRATALGDTRLEPGETVHLSWTAANRDPHVFDEPDGYDPGAHHEANLVFGTGPHVCPGRALTLMELRVALEELLGRTDRLEPSDEPAVRQAPPLGGWARVPVVLR